MDAKVFEKDVRELMAKYNTGIFFVAVYPDQSNGEEESVVLSDAPSGWLKVICAGTLENIRLQEADVKKRIENGEIELLDPEQSMGNQGDTSKLVHFPTPKQNKEKLSLEELAHVHLNEDDGKWYFLDENLDKDIGPYDTREEAVEELNKYAEKLFGRKMDEVSGKEEKTEGKEEMGEVGEEEDGSE